MSKNFEQPENIYYDCNICNLESIGITSTPCNFTETRNTPIIRNAEQYKMSIVKFQLDTISLPTWIPQITKGTQDEMIDIITLEYVDASGNKTDVSQNLTWINTNTHIASPSESEEYYYANSYSHFATLMNNTFDLLISDLKIAIGVDISDSLAPVMIFDDALQQFQLFSQKKYYNETLTTNTINIYFNRALYGKLSTFDALKNYNNANNKIYKIITRDLHSIHTVLLDVSGSDIEFIKTSQEFSTIGSFLAVSSIVFTTTSIPVIPNQLSTPQIYDNGLLLTTTIPSTQENIITDMSVESNYKSNLIYTPSGQNRYISLSGNGNISTINFNVYWMDKTGALHQFYLQSGNRCSVKFLFELKR
jgi:hypothetical protein